MAKSIFNFESEDRVQSPERLNEYIKVATPGVWVMALALLLVLTAFVIWGFTGRIPRLVTLRGGVDPTSDHVIYATVDAARYDIKLLMEKDVEFKLPSGVNGRGKVVDTTKVPLSREEIDKNLESDFLASALVSSDYSNILKVETDVDLSQSALEVGEVTVIVDEVPPISFISN